MEILVDYKSFIEAVNWVTKKIYDNSDTIFISIDPKKKVGTMVYDSRNIFLKSNFAVNQTDLTKAFNITVGVEMIKNLSAALKFDKQEEFSITSKDKENTQLIVKNGRDKFTLWTNVAKNRKENEITKVLEVNGSEFLGIMNRLSKFCSDDKYSVMEALQSIDVNFCDDDGNNRIEFMSTDRFALGFIEMPFAGEFTKPEFSSDEGHLLLPYRMASLVKPIDETITLIVDNKGKRFGYEFENGFVMLYPIFETKRISPDTVLKRATEEIVGHFDVATKDLLVGIQKLDLLADKDDNNMYCLVSSDGKIELTDSDKTNKVSVPMVSYENGAPAFEIGEDGVSIYLSKLLMREIIDGVSSANIRVSYHESLQLPLFVQQLLDNGQAEENIKIVATTAKNN